ncbi:uncharacterized protein PV06_08865 [Exophiala oligosperma]|uniref:YAG7-like dimerisation domain-containing protein n=1 Tax=Exophiala oligosperma TaxID=215243 RepID=A0A0D2AG18_9EURO|nr:uncharacterized protein PV06_08865 [Exophiala oligosperma]KIW39051.1 hypothetical protein PV06_08865 [Exophiala oligosperma]
MSSAAPAPVDSKSAKKRKAKVEKPTSESDAPAPSVDATPSEAQPTTNGVDSHGDSTFVKDLQRNIRNIHKKLAASHKADSVIAENPKVSLDDLVAQKKLNADQKAQILKKPALQAQLSQLEEQLQSFRTFAQDLEDKFAKEKSALVESHEAEVASLKQKVLQEAEDAKSKAIEDGLRVITHFLHTAASKRQSEDADSEEGRAFEGALLLVYQGNETSLMTLKSLIYGTEEKVLDVQGEALDYTFAQVKQSALQEAQELVQPNPQEVEAVPLAEASAVEIQVDQTVANAGLTELGDTATVPVAGGDGAEPQIVQVAEQATTGDEAANAVAESSWDPQASQITDTSATNEEWVQVPRDPAETETGVAATPAAMHGSSSWAEEVGAAAAVEEKANADNDGFEQVRRERGRGRGGRGGRGDFRGRGRGGNRGDGYRGGRGGQNKGRGGQRGGGGGAQS